MTMGGLAGCHNAGLLLVVLLLFFAEPCEDVLELVHELLEDAQEKSDPVVLFPLLLFFDFALSLRVFLFLLAMLLFILFLEMVFSCFVTHKDAIP